MSNARRMESAMTLTFQLGGGIANNWDWLEEIEEVLRRQLRGEMQPSEERFSRAEARRLVKSISQQLQDRLVQDYGPESVDGSPWEWAAVVSAAAQRVLRASSSGSQPHHQGTATKLLLLASAEAGLPFVCPGEAGWLKLYFGPLHDDGIIKRARWLENGESINRPFDSLRDRHPDQLVRLDTYVSAEIRGAVRGYGLTRSGPELFQSELVKLGLDGALLTSMIATVRAGIQVPTDYPKPLMVNPDAELQRQLAQQAQLPTHNRTARRAGQVNA